MKSLVIDTKTVRSNVQAVRTAANGVQIYADLSGDAYGMGLVEMAKLLRDEGISRFIVGEPKDAIALRNNGFENEHIMMLRSTADSSEIETLLDLGVICTVGSYDAAVAINGIAAKRGTVCEVQIEVDTGMGRYGFMDSELDKMVSIFKFMSNLAVVGMFTTFSDSWRSESVTRTQLGIFENVVDKLTEMGFDVGVTHACDSAAIFRYDFGRMDAVRVGTAFSGRVEGKNIPDLNKVGYIEAGIEELGWFSKGRHIGKYRLRRTTRLAVLSVGYYHGFSVNRFERDMSFIDRLRSRWTQLYVKIGANRVRVVGRVGMMHTVIDVTDVECAVGDTVIMDVDPVDVKGIARQYR